MTQKNKNEDKIIKPLTILTNKEKYYYIMLMEFYKKCNPEDIQQMLDIINGKSMLSLRIIDWFVTRCSFKYKICIDNGNELFNIYISYKAQLKSYKKKYFDPFRRNSKFYFHYDLNDDTKYIYTTFGQLNFFKWAISNNVLQFIKNNFNFIITTMSSNKDSKIRKKNMSNKCFQDEKKNKNKIEISNDTQPILNIKIKQINNDEDTLSSQMINFICDEKLKNDIIKIYQKIKDDYLYSNVLCSHLISHTNHKQIINFENNRDCINNKLQLIQNISNHDYSKSHVNIKNTNTYLKNNIKLETISSRNLHTNSGKGLLNQKFESPKNFQIFSETNSKILNKPIVLFFD